MNMIRLFAFLLIIPTGLHSQSIEEKALIQFLDNHQGELYKNSVFLLSNRTNESSDLDGLCFLELLSGDPFPKPNKDEIPQSMNISLKTFQHNKIKKRPGFFRRIFNPTSIATIHVYKAIQLNDRRTIELILIEKKYSFSFNYFLFGSNGDLVDHCTTPVAKTH